MASESLVPPVADLISQGDSAADVSASIAFYEAARNRLQELSGSDAADLLCKLSSAYLTRGMEGDVAYAAVYASTAAANQPNARTLLLYGKAVMACGMSQRTVGDCGESMRRSFQQALSVVDNGLALAPGDAALTELRTEIEHLVATLKAPSPPCEVCGQAAENRCSRCGLKTYCSAACQRAHWTVHKRFCCAPARPASSSGHSAASPVAFGDAQTFGFYPEPLSLQRSRLETDQSIAVTLAACKTTLSVYIADGERAAALRASAAELNAMHAVSYHDFSSSLVGSIWNKRGHGTAVAIGAGLSPNLDICIDKMFSTSLLGMAVIARDLDAVRLLLAVGAQVDRGCPAMMATPLILAARSHQHGIVEELVDAGADLRAADKNGFTALHWMLMGSSSGTLSTKALSSLFDSTSSSSAAQALDYYRGLQKLCTPGAPLSSLNCHGLAPLHVAAAEGDVTAISMLVAAGADAQQPSGNGAMPLTFALRGGHHKAAALLTSLSAV